MKVVSQERFEIALRQGFKSRNQSDSPEPAKNNQNQRRTPLGHVTAEIRSEKLKTTQEIVLFYTTFGNDRTF